MSADYHHTVIAYATPNGDFTKWCIPLDNESMPAKASEFQDLVVAARRENAARGIRLYFDDNQSAFAREYARVIGRPDSPRQSFISDLIRPGSKKSFGEKVARQFEAALGVKRGELDIPGSKLVRDHARYDRIEDELREALSGLTSDQKRDALDAIRKIARPQPRRTPGKRPHSKPLE